MLCVTVCCAAGAGEEEASGGSLPSLCMIVLIVTHLMAMRSQIDILFPVKLRKDDFLVIGLASCNPRCTKICIGGLTNFDD